MPCCTCTTGSPARSSERSRSMPSTELTRVRALEGFCAHEKILGAQEKLRGREQWPRAVACEELVAALRVAPEFGEALVHFAVHADRGALRQVVEDRRGSLEEQRQVVLDPGGRDAVAHILVD